MGYRVTGLDIMAEAVRHGQCRGLAQLRVHDLVDPWPLESNSASVVVLLDVLEHMENPVLVLSHVREVLKPGGGLVFTVPAYNWLYGDWDRQLGHYRRYSAKEIREHAGEAGLTLSWLTHWNAFTFPAAAAVRGYQRLFPRESRGTAFPKVARSTNQMLLAMADVERWLIRHAAVPFGLSLVGVLRKQ
jgi:SAM-dependent methyltransferase